MQPEERMPKDEDLAFITIRGNHREALQARLERMLSNRERFKVSKNAPTGTKGKFLMARKAHMKWFIHGLKEGDGKYFDIYVRAEDNSFILVEGKDAIEKYLGPKKK
ncbi:MAG: hypothetical protein QG653_567 [Patescibacteria group bacterium]|nr:hypothetical protein [Patescibacteria group bacterium]